MEQTPQHRIGVFFPRALAEHLQITEETCRFGAIIQQKGIIVVPVALEHPHHGQAVGGEAVHRGAQHGDKGHILPRVINKLQHGEGHGDLHRFEKRAALLCAAGDAPPRQRRGKGTETAAGRAHQNREILSATGTQRTIAVVDRESITEHLLDLPRHEVRLHGGAVEALLLRVHHINKMELGGAVLRFGIVGSAEMKGFLLPIVHLAHGHGHDVFEDEVGGLQHLITRAEIAGQQNTTRLVTLCILRICKANILFKKNGRIGEAEAVNTLLHVANGEEILLLTGDGGEDAVLHLVGILILVHHDLAVAAGHLPGKLRRLTILTEKQFDGEMLLVGEVQCADTHLLILIGAAKRRRQIGEGHHGRCHGLEILQMLGGGNSKIGGKLLYIVLALLPKSLHLLLFFAVATDSLQAIKGRNGLRHLLPCCTVGKTAQLRRSIRKGPTIGNHYRLFRQFIHRFFKAICPELGAAGAVG